MGLRVSQGGDRTRGVPDQYRVFVGPEFVEEGQPEPGSGFDVVGERPVDDRETKGQEFALEPGYQTSPAVLPPLP